MQGFIEFIRKQGIVGLAIGFILGGAISKLVSSFVGDIVNPILGIVLGKVENLKDVSLVVGHTKIMWGDFLAVLVDFIVVALVVYFGVKWLKLDKLDKKE